MTAEIVKEWEHAGFKCQITKHPEMGHYCGYVWLPKEHPFAGRRSSDINDLVYVHGGITFTEWAEKGKEKFYVVGFDYAHARDYVPGLSFAFPDDHAWTLEEVTEEVNSFAEKLTIPNLVERKLSQ